jgi:VanZ family protein
MTDILIKDGRAAGRRYASALPSSRGTHRVPGFKTLGRLAAGACVVAVAVLSLLPAENMARTGFGGHIEHLSAYLGTTTVAAMAFSERGDLAIFLALSSYAAVLEVLQRYSPGRISSIEDFMFSAGGVVLGIAAAAFLRKTAARNGIGKG